MKKIVVIVVFMIGLTVNLNLSNDSSKSSQLRISLAKEAHAQSQDDGEPNEFIPCGDVMCGFSTYWGGICAKWWTPICYCYCDQ